MEESEKRRERLKAMRMEAAQTSDVESPGSAPGALSNPLIETATAIVSPHQYNTLPRFDYYTDPMSAFSGSKRMNKISPQVPQGNYNTPPRPMDHGMIPNPGPGILNVPRAHFNQGPVGNPMGAVSPLYRPQQNPPSSYVGSGASFDYSIPPNFSRAGNFPRSGSGQEGPPYVDYDQGRGHQGQNTVSPLYRPQQNPPSSYVGSGGSFDYGIPPNFSRGGNFPRSGSGQGGSPYVDYDQGRGHQGQNTVSPLYRPQQNPPSSWVGSGGSFDYGTRPNFSRGGNFSRPGSGQGGTPYVDYGRGRGRGYQGQNMNSHDNSGRGRGRSQYQSHGNRSPVGSGPSFGRGENSYYRKEMVEDPWLGLSPVVWKGVGMNDSDKSWLPKSIAMKKLKASPEAPQASIPQQSLAEYLAASFDDSVNEAVEDQKACDIYAPCKGPIV